MRGLKARANGNPTYDYYSYYDYEYVSFLLQIFINGCIIHFIIIVHIIIINFIFHASGYDYDYDNDTIYDCYYDYTFNVIPCANARIIVIRKIAVMIVIVHIIGIMKSIFLLFGYYY